MKKIGLLLIAASILFACDPIENRMDTGTTTITADDLKISATPVMKESAENPGTQVRSNYIQLNSEGNPVLSSWFYGTGTYVGTNGIVQVVVPGKQTITFTGLGPDGTKLTKDVEVEVDECFDVAPQWGYLCGEGSKVWTWNEERNLVYGKGAYLSDTAPTWWKVTIDGTDGADVTEKVENIIPGEGPGATMEFSVVGSAFVKTRTDGSKQNGSFSFSYTEADVVPDAGGNPWAEGTLNMSGATVLAGVNTDDGKAPVYSYHILRLTDEYLNLAFAPPGSGAWDGAFFWQFKAKE
ncbi:MAG: hypothetical protein LBV32_08890 [Tannerellaceae bacterium]|nr:hypothetical protein [Tannerellaceae bacterium]